MGNEGCWYLCSAKVPDAEGSPGRLTPYFPDGWQCRAWDPNTTGNVVFHLPPQAPRCTKALEHGDQACPSWCLLSQLCRDRVASPAPEPAPVLLRLLDLSLLVRAVGDHCRSCCEHSRGLSSSYHTSIWCTCGLMCMERGAEPSFLPET